MNPRNERSGGWAAAGLGLLLLAIPGLGLSQTNREGGADAESEGRRLAEDLRSRRASEVLRVEGVIETRSASGVRTTRPLRMLAAEEGAEWVIVYEVGSSGDRPGQRLAIRKSEARPNRYVFQEDWDAASPGSAARALEGSEAMTPFAGSDFLLTELGLDHLFWPTQRVLRVKQSMRKGRACRVLESSRPADGGKGYTRVRSWVDVESGGPIYAEAFDGSGARAKTFEVDSVAKVDGRWQVKDLKMRDDHTDSRTWIRFEFKPTPR